MTMTFKMSRQLCNSFGLEFADTGIDNETIEQAFEEQPSPLDKLTFIKELGSGKNGTVNLVEDEFGNQFALKIQSNKSSNQNEANINKKLGRLHDFFEKYDSEYMLMDYVKGSVLGDFLYESYETKQNIHGFANESIMKLSLAIAMITEIEALLAQNIVNLDYNENNFIILQNNDGTIVVTAIDFGSAKELDPNSPDFHEEKNCELQTLLLHMGSLGFRYDTKPFLSYNTYQRLKDLGKDASSEQMKNVLLEQLNEKIQFEKERQAYYQRPRSIIYSHIAEDQPFIIQNQEVRPQNTAQITMNY